MDRKPRIELVMPSNIEEAHARLQENLGRIDVLTDQLRSYRALISQGHPLPFYMREPTWWRRAGTVLEYSKREVRPLKAWISTYWREHSEEREMYEFGDEADPDSALELLAACWSLLRAAGTYGVSDQTTKEVALGSADVVRDYLRKRAPRLAERHWFISMKTVRPSQRRSMAAS